MKYLLKSLLIVFVVSFPSLAQSDWHTYPVRSIAAIIAMHPPEAAKNSDIIISANPFPSKMALVYTGKSRPISEETKRFIGLWVETRNVPRENADLLIEEFSFREKDREFWIPVITRDSPLFKKILKEGDELIVYYFLLGGYNPKKLHEKSPLKEKTAPPEDKIEWIFAVEAFQKSVYKTQPLAAAIDPKLESSVDKADFQIDPRQVKSKSSLVFTGEVRNASDAKIRFLERWAEKNEVPLGVVALFREEARFREGEREYWLPVRKTILDEMRARLKKGETVEIHTILAGGFKQRDAFEWVFIVGEFSR